MRHYDHGVMASLPIQSNGEAVNLHNIYEAGIWIFGPLKKKDSETFTVIIGTNRSGSTVKVLDAPRQSAADGNRVESRTSGLIDTHTFE